MGKGVTTIAIQSWSTKLRILSVTEMIDGNEEQQAHPEGSSLKIRVKRWIRTHRIEILLFLLLWGTYAYFYQSTQDNEAARLDQTRAIVQDHTLSINKYRWNSADVIQYQKRGSDYIYPAKAPGMSLLAVFPFGFFLAVLNAFRAAVTALGRS